MPYVRRTKVFQKVLVDPKIYTNCFQDVIQHKVRMRIATLQCKDVGKGAERLSGENGQIERN